MKRFLLPFFAAILIAAPAMAAPVFVRAHINLRAGPGTGYPVVAMLSPNMPLQVDSCLEGYGWCEVQAGPAYGWVASNYLYAQQDNRQVVFMQAAPEFGVPIVTFELGNYWNQHYRNRSFYRQRSHWESYGRAHPYRAPAYHSNNRGPQHDNRGPGNSDHGNDRHDDDHHDDRGRDDHDHGDDRGDRGPHR